MLSTVSTVPRTYLGSGHAKNCDPGHVAWCPGRACIWARKELKPLAWSTVPRTYLGPGHAKSKTTGKKHGPLDVPAPGHAKNYDPRCGALYPGPAWVRGEELRPPARITVPRMYLHLGLQEIKIPGTEHGNLGVPAMLQIMAYRMCVEFIFGEGSLWWLRIPM